MKINCLSVILVNQFPFIRDAQWCWALVVDEVTSLSKTAKSLFLKGVADFCFVGSIMFHIYSQLMRTVSELALLSIGTHTFWSKVFAEGSLGFAWKVRYCPLIVRAIVIFIGELVLVSFGWGLTFEIKGFAGKRYLEITGAELHVDWINDYNQLNKVA